MRPVLFKRTYRCGNTDLELGNRTLIMGILNVTPDSFSDGGLWDHPDKAVEHALRMAAEGADIIDIGGESTRPGHQPVGLEEELARVLPVIESIHKAAPHLPLSIDTYKAEVAHQAIAAGAHIINDIWGCKADPEMAAVAAAADCPIILMHNRQDRNYTNLSADMSADLKESIDLAVAAGVKPANIILDPGIGFAKDYNENLQAMTLLDGLTELGYPLLLATSRKKFIRTVLDLPSDDVVEGTAATVAFGIAQGCQIVRVHDVSLIKRTVKMCDAMLYAAPPLVRE
ncbi:dihydropteroate synthase [Paenibacillus odorifer]|uniref:Dihydropteroate synthase n=1 Tax=Paenibacillus odorifer TaxID=189426 RepID=A0A1R0X0E6_9BACL|nr:MULTISPECIES: dihydropteroate synthase [Paenibacillus]AIQ71870.1 dihydropteroate synthase [Paenibacillus odorifer]ETT65122.1 dihydropteroate synthase (dihydropteroate pyrophosphorylase) [Paenibacillus sp. FSL H8-237]OMD26069.1 dihydropteroate synthase [Paenibacillus odorifer]OME33414.1 dihydropteroate synthase [Paenibacillus odorifer]OME47681.1 dihydropteroate synthase [Paenibacillus odorifer]